MVLLHPHKGDPTEDGPLRGWGVPVQVSMEVAVAFHVLGRRHQAFMLSAGRFIIPSPGRTQSGFLCAATSAHEWQPTGEHTLRVRDSCQAKCNCWWSWGGCKSSLWELFGVVDPTLNQEGKEETAFSTLSISTSYLCLVRCRCMHTVSTLANALSL